MSDVGGTKVDLGNRKRVGPEDESREGQFEDNDLEAERREGNPAPGRDAPQDVHDLAHSNDLTTP